MVRRFVSRARGPRASEPAVQATLSSRWKSSPIPASPGGRQHLIGNADFPGGGGAGRRNTSTNSGGRGHHVSAQRVEYGDDAPPERQRSTSAWRRERGRTRQIENYTSKGARSGT